MKKRLFYIFVSIPLLMGCGSAYLYETEKLSLTVEARGNDAAQPVSANLGLKQRVALIVPGKGGDEELTSEDIEKINDKMQSISANTSVSNFSNLVNLINNLNSAKRQNAVNLVTKKIYDNFSDTSTAYINWEKIISDNDIVTEKYPGEASSVVSYFNYKFKANTWSLNDNESTIDTVILTGDAASNLRKQAPRVFQDISSTGIGKISILKVESLKTMYAGLNFLSNSGDTVAGQHLVAVNQLHSFAPARIPFSFYSSDPAIPANFNVKPINTPNPDSKNNNFDDVTKYLKLLHDIDDILTTMIKTNGLMIGGNPVSDESEVKADISSRQKNLNKKIEEILGNPSLLSALNYYVYKTFMK
ncbi:FAD-dependent dehydrogenase [Candidatus Scalindua japonica]|uniref:FAD-dependent dehydrogenase n=1 Tax=Candidatus Scalindua japonica TaxID=1284222 RepID=A0A286TU00_9BACT|nr:hypothetical protein [Candidatus Scalindua japonica]GAX59331.1 FAD-dependent dehydrogenase [Candidatus Scalindua japonica]